MKNLKKAKKKVIHMLRSQKTLVRLASLLGIFAMLVISGVLHVPTAQAGAVTAAKDTMSTLTKSVQGTHAFSFTTATALTATETINILFDEAGDAFTLDATIANTDFSSVTGMTMVANVGACDGGATDQVYPSVDASAPGESYTLTVCTSDTVTAGAKTFTIDSNEITNPSTQGTYIIDITTSSDSGALAVGIVDDDSVNITATVDPSITFTISDVTVGFGTLSSSAVRYATGDLAGGTTETTAAHQIRLGTNATGGAVLTYNGATLNSGGDTISAGTTIDGGVSEIGSELFALAVDDINSSFTIADGAAYDQDAADYKFVAGATTDLVSSIGPVDDLGGNNLDLHYVANIASDTEAGTYTTDITYIATGTF